MNKRLDRLSIKIALLSLITDLPEPPSVESPVKFTEAHGIELPGRTLSFKHEISITQHLAFVCAYSGDPLHVLAICVEEGNAGDGLTIHLAANTGTAHVHAVLINGLNKILTILQDEALNS